MKVVSAEAFPGRDRAGLLSFLQRCQQCAQRDGRNKYASITLSVRHIDPLAVLESIYEPNELHAYFEHPSTGEALAGADAIAAATFSGPERFISARAFVESIASDCVAVGDLDAPFAGPQFLFAFGFCNSGDDSAAEFPPATIFLPRWQVARCGTQYSATANVPISLDSDVEALADRVLAAHERFHAFPYREVSASSSIRITERRELHSREHFEEAVERALNRIRQEELTKVVLARALELKSETLWKPLTCANRLRQRFPGCHVFSIGNGEGVGFIGATPERLVRLSGSTIETEAVAGSAPRGVGAGEDARYAQKLLMSEKELREHQYVVDTICNRLSRLGALVHDTSAPGLLELANVRHLRSAIAADVGERRHVFEFIEALHPTPAVGGVPCDLALATIAELEGFSRGLYSGVVGWVNAHGEGEGLVAIRSGLVCGSLVRLYAGAGIVDGSIAEAEYAETEMKFNALLEALLYE